MTVKVSAAQRRARLLSRHQLSGPAATAASVTAAADAMVALHATDPVTVYLSARARVPSATVPSMWMCTMLSPMRLWAMRLLRAA